jgi:hypothetical protein
MYKEQTCAFSIYTDKMFALSQHEKLTDENGNQNIKAVKILIPLVHEAEARAICYKDFQNFS